MPIHHRIIPEIIKYGSRGSPIAKGVLTSDRMALNYAWKGFRHKSSIVGGIRTGLLAGSVAGTFISDDGLDDTDGLSFTPTSKFYKTRRRYSRCPSGQYSSGRGRYRKCRQYRKHFKRIPYRKGRYRR